MNIIFFARLFYPHIGGVEKHVMRVSEELIKAGNKVSIVTEGFKKDLAEFEVYGDIRIFRIPVFPTLEKSKKWLIWKWLLAHQQLIFEADIVHIHDVFYWFIPFLFRKRFYLTYHGYEGYKSPTLSAIGQRKVGELLASGTICVGDYMRKWYGARPNLVTYGAVDKRPVGNRKTIKATAIYVGRLSEDSGIMMYLMALKLLRDKGISIRLTVFGDGPQKSEAERYSGTNSLAVRFRGYDDTVINHYQDFELAFVSRYLAIVEAMQVKRPIFAVYNNDIKKDYLRCHPQAKSIAISENEKELADAVSDYYLNSGKWRRRVDEAHNWVKEQSWQQVVKLYRQLWKNGKETFKYQ